MDFALIIHTLFSLLTLTFLEIVLGIDNLVFLAVVSAKLPKEQQKLARRLGLMFALFTRLMLLAAIVWLVQLKNPLFSLLSHPVSIRDLILFAGGGFLIYKSLQEIHHEMITKAIPTVKKFSISVSAIVFQIGILDIIFSLDSVFTAVGLTNNYGIMATAIFIAILTMLFLSEPLTAIIDRRPRVKILALSFLLLIGIVLIADGFHYYIPREYIYFTISFSVFTEFLNSMVKRRGIHNNK